MPRLFDITTPTNTVVLNKHRRGQAAFALTNISGQPRRARLLLVPKDPQAGPWLSLEGQPTRELAIAETQEARVDIAVPADAPAGTYSFRLDAAREDLPDEDYAEGPAVTLRVPEAEPKPGFPRWVVPVVLGVLAIVGGVTFYLVSRNRAQESSATATAVAARTATARASATQRAQGTATASAGTQQAAHTATALHQTATARAHITVTFTHFILHNQGNSFRFGSAWPEIRLDLAVNDQALRWPASGEIILREGQTVDVGESLSLTLDQSQALQLVVRATWMEIFRGRGVSDVLDTLQLTYARGDEWGAGGHSELSPNGSFTIRYTISVEWE